MKLKSLTLDKFTAFDHLELSFSKGINVFIGANGTGKTHVMKVLYAACDITRTEQSFASKLVGVFLPKDRQIGRLARRQRGTVTSTILLRSDKTKLGLTFSSHTGVMGATGEGSWWKSRIDAAYIPVKEMLSNAPGFLALYEHRDVHFEAVYADILHRAYLPLPRGPIDATSRKLLKILETALEGRVTTSSEQFFLDTGKGENLEFTLLAEGMRKLGLLWLLIRNGTLQRGSVQLWDEPETNLNPALYGTVIEMLLELQRMGVQIFLATHDYLILKELELRSTKKDALSFFGLHRSPDTKQVECHVSDSYAGLHPNMIADAFADVFTREVEKSFGGKI